MEAIIMRFFLKSILSIILDVIGIKLRKRQPFKDPYGFWSINFTVHLGRGGTIKKMIWTVIVKTQNLFERIRTEPFVPQWTWHNIVEIYRCSSRKERWSTNEFKVEGYEQEKLPLYQDKLLILLRTREHWCHQTKFIESMSVWYNVW